MKHRARKRFGQNFLNDAHIIERIVTSIIASPGDQIVEIGPGLGALTAPLIKHYGSITAIEIDRDLSKNLALNYGPSLTLVNADVLDVALSTLPITPPFRCVGNLPYNISTPILFHLLKHLELIQDIHIMLQKEVADRMAALPNNKTYGKLSVILQNCVDVESLFDIPPEAFDPAPKVQSTFLRLQPLVKHRPSPETLKHLQYWTQQAFSQRRKVLRNTLKSFPAELCEAANIDLTQRAENLTPQQFRRLAELSLANQLEIPER